MSDRKLLGIGVIGTDVIALCSFTSVLIILLGLVGLSAWVGWLDYVLFPALGFLVGITVYALIRRNRRWRAASSVSAGHAETLGISNE